jgi:hypothetical protein
MTANSSSTIGVLASPIANSVLAQIEGKILLNLFCIHFYVVLVELSELL